MIRRGSAEILVDGETVGTTGWREPLGELALMYGTRREMTVKTIGPCEVFKLDRATYETGIATLEPDQRQGPLVKIMQRFWELVTGPDGSNRPEVDYKVYLRYHNRVSKTLMNQAEGLAFDVDDQRELALEDWAEDCKRFGVKTTGAMTCPMYFDSVYQMVYLWAGGLNLSYVGLLELLFDNIAHDENLNSHTSWAFKHLDDVKCCGEKLEEIMDDAREEMEAGVAAKKEADDRYTQEAEEAVLHAREKRERVREVHALSQAQQQKADMETEQAVLDSRKEDLMAKIDAGDEAAKIELARVEKQRLQVKMEMIQHDADADPDDVGAQERIAAAKLELEVAVQAVQEAEALLQDQSEESQPPESAESQPPPAPNDSEMMADVTVDAVTRGDANAVQELLDNGANTNMQSKGWPAPALAAQRGNLEVMNALVAAGADVEVTVPSGATALIVAADAGQMECTASLLQAGARLDATRDDGATALHMAAARGLSDVAELLLDAGANPEVMDKKGVSPLAIASKNGYTDIVDNMVAHIQPGRLNQGGSTRTVQPGRFNADGGGAGGGARSKNTDGKNKTAVAADSWTGGGVAVDAERGARQLIANNYPIVDRDLSDWSAPHRPSGAHLSAERGAPHRPSQRGPIKAVRPETLRPSEAVRSGEGMDTISQADADADADRRSRLIDRLSASSSQHRASTPRLPPLGPYTFRKPNLATMAQQDPYCRAEWSDPHTAMTRVLPQSMQSLKQLTLNSSKSAAGMPRTPHMPLQGEHNNALHREQWHDTFERKHTDGMGSVADQLQSLIGPNLAGVVSKIVLGICSEAERNLAEDGLCRPKLKKMSLTHLRMLHGHLRGGSIVIEAVHSYSGEEETGAVRIVVTRASSPGVSDPCIVCLGFRGPLDVMHFGSPSYRWDPVALGEAVVAARAACRDHTNLTRGGRFSTPVFIATATAQSRLIAYGEAKISILGVRDPVSWQYREQFRETVKWLRAGEHVAGQWAGVTPRKSARPLEHALPHPPVTRRQTTQHHNRATTTAELHIQFQAMQAATMR